MLNEKIIELGKNSSEIRELYEYGDKRKAEIGAEKVFDFSIGNPDLEPPEDIKRSLEKQVAACREKNFHGYILISN